MHEKLAPTVSGDERAIFILSLINNQWERELLFYFTDGDVEALKS